MLTFNILFVNLVLKHIFVITNQIETAKDIMIYILFADYLTI